LRHNTELVVTSGLARLVVQPLFDGEGFLVPPLGFVEIAAQIGYIAKFMAVSVNS
jgi:hypothetical protein